MILDKDNAAVKAAQAKVQQKLGTIKFEEYRTEANDFLQKKDFFRALQSYEKCLKITR